MIKKYSQNNVLYRVGRRHQYLIGQRIKLNSIQSMETKAEQLLNPNKYYLSDEAKKRLKWMYVLYYQSKDNVTKAANRLGISRQWLSEIKSIFEKNNKDPHSLEPQSRAPHHTEKRKRINKYKEDKILEVRDKYGWGKEKTARVLLRDHLLKISPSTVNRYLRKHCKINIKISLRNQKVWEEKKEREKEETLTIKYRPPNRIKDYAPGALIEKDMKLVPKWDTFGLPQGPYHLKDYFYFQHSFLDSFTRIRGLELSQEPSSGQAATAYEEIKKRLPFDLATINTDGGGENEKDFSQLLKRDNVVHFYSRTATPTDNPRVERSHLTDQKEHYQREGIKKSFKEEKVSLREWEYIYNRVRPNQALGYLTPIEFYELWKRQPEQAYKIVEDYQDYLKKQRKRLANSRKMKRREQIDKLMVHIERKLGSNLILKVNNFQFSNCQLCS